MKERKKNADNRVWVLRTCASDMASSHGFVWPKSGPVECNDWSPEEECGHGLHGLLWGAGDGLLLDWSPDAKWLVVAVDAATIIDLGGKVKFPRGEVVHCGDRLSATAFISNDPHAVCVVGATATAGDRGTAMAGHFGTAMAGDHGTAMAGICGTAMAGDLGELRIRWFDFAAHRYRTAIAYVGENGIKARVAYRLDNEHQFVEVQQREQS